MSRFFSICINKLPLAFAIANICLAANCASQSDMPVQGTDDGTSAKADRLLNVAMPSDVSSQIIDYPGFRVSFNADFRQPNWVAWELTGKESMADVANRKQAKFMPDDNVEGCATLEDYKGSGYERGHMCPAGDMKWSIDAMNSCFLLTNICPQTSKLNGGSWNSLENKCREWAVRDSAIIIICGPILSDHLTRTIGPGKVAVPERFFKVVLAPHGPRPRAIGFIMTNGYSQGGMQTAAASVDHVEHVTGFDFFASLPDEVESAVESQNNFPQWSQPAQRK